MPDLALLYTRVSSKGQATLGMSLDAQATALKREAVNRGWRFELLVETQSAGSMRNRPVLEDALARLKAKQAGVLMVARMDRAFRSVGDFATVMARAEREGWLLRMLDPDVDMGTPYGRAMAGVAAVFAQLERELISQRTREGIQAAKAAGTYRGGVSSTSGCPVDLGSAAAARIAELRADGLGPRPIARRLTLEGFETPRSWSVAWSHGTVRNVIARQTADKEATA